MTNNKIKLIGAAKNFINIKKWVEPNIFFQSSKYKYYKHFLFLNYVVLQKGKIGIQLYIYLNLLLKYSYFWLPNKVIYLNLLKNKNNIYLLSYGLENRFLLKYKFSITFFNYLSLDFQKKWKIFEYFFIPNKFWFNRQFLLSKPSINMLITLYTYKFVQFKKYFLFLDTMFKSFFQFKINLSSIDIGNVLFNSIKLLKHDKIILDCNLWSFLQSNRKIWKSFYSFSWILPNKYDSFWSFLNVSLFLTWSFLFQYNISSSGFDVWNLLLFNYMFFWYGDKPRDYNFEYYAVWGWWNFIYRKGSPYTSLKFGEFWNNLLLNLNNVQKNNLTINYYLIDSNSWIKNKKIYYFVLFNNYIFMNKNIPKFSILNSFKTEK